MLPATPVPLLVLRLATEHKPWRLPREAGLRLRLINVPVSYGPGEPGLPYAFPALPGRYLADMVELAFQEDWKGPKAILNPALTHHPGTLAAVLAETEDLAFGSASCPDPEWLLLQDYSERVVAYLIPPAWQPDEATLHELR